MFEVHIDQKFYNFVRFIFCPIEFEIRILNPLRHHINGGNISTGCTNVLHLPWQSDLKVQSSWYWLAANQTLLFEFLTWNTFGNFHLIQLHLAIFCQFYLNFGQSSDYSGSCLVWLPNWLFGYCREVKLKLAISHWLTIWLFSTLLQALLLDSAMVPLHCLPMERVLKHRWMLKALKDPWNFNDPGFSINWRVIRNRHEWDHKWSDPI